jgi:lipopolysaccharide biosynthesis glycosyltransferase
VIRARRVQVLFPLELQRVIFLDADLVLRADLRELWTMDLKVSSAMPVQIVRPRVPH